MKVSIRKSLRLRESDLPPGAQRAILRAFTYSNSEYHRRVDAGVPVGELMPTFHTFARSSGYLYLPRGASRRLTAILVEYGSTVDLDDQSVTAPVHWPAYRGKLRKYQRRAEVSAMLGRQGVIVGGCGSGKTEILLAVAAHTGQRTLVLVDTKDLQAQWIERFVDRYDCKPGDVGAIGGLANESRGADWSVVNRKEPGRVLTVATAQTIRNSPEVLEEFGTLLADEVHLWAAKTFREVVAHSPSAWRIGGTATLQRSDGLVEVITDTFGDILYEVSEAELEAEGVKQEVGIELVSTDFFVDARPSVRYTKAGKRFFGPMPWADVERKMTEDGRRHYKAIRTCQRAAREGITLILSKRREYANRIGYELHETGLRVSSLFGGSGRASDCLDCGHFPEKEGKRKTCENCGAPLLYRVEHNAETLRRLREGEIDAAVATSVADKALDVPRLERIVVVLPTAGGRGTPVSARFKQQLGRLGRVVKGKAAPKMYYLIDLKMGFGRDRDKTIRRTFDNVV